MATTKIEFQIRGVDVAIDYENRQVWFDDELPKETVRVLGRYLVDEGFINPEKNTEFHNE